MIESKALLSDLKKELSSLEADLTERAEDPSTDWGAQLREDYDRAKKRDRTGLSWIDWRGGEVSQAAVAWIIAAVFIRFCEDNGLLSGAKRDGKLIAQPWIAAPGDGLERAVENESAFYTAAPTMTGRDWLQHAFTTLAELPAGRTLVDPEYSPVWRAPISASAADRLLAFFRQVDAERELVHDFADPDLDTRFLGDLYQDLSDYAKKTFALLQTPDFVEEFILEQTLTPAIKEFGLTGLKLIDPACGSGHFLLGAFQQLVEAWGTAAPGTDRGDRVQRALDSIHGVDLNPFAIAIARFRLTVAALRASDIKSLVNAPAFKLYLAIGDSLLGGSASNIQLDLGDGEYVPYATEDLSDYAGILESGQYHVVVANPPYITVKDKTLNLRYRELYSMCSGPYALTVPFMELLFRLAMPAQVGHAAGYVGQITGNSFMKRGFGKKLIEQFISGGFTGVRPDYVDLTHIVDTSGAYLPGHGTPTVILVGRPQQPKLNSVRAVLGVRGEPKQPEIPARGKVWREIVEHFDNPGYNGQYVSVMDISREVYSRFPWSLTGGGANELLARIDAQASILANEVEVIGRTTHTGLDDAFFRPMGYGKRHHIADIIGAVFGSGVRNYQILEAQETLFPYTSDGEARTPSLNFSRDVWPLRTSLKARIDFGSTPEERGLRWFDHSMFFPKRYKADLGIAFSNVESHNHFALNYGSSVFTSHSPVIMKPEGAQERDYYQLLGVLNSSTALFWLKQVSYPKGGDPVGADGARVSAESWSDRYEFTSKKLKDFPLPVDRAIELTRHIDTISRLLERHAPAVVLGTIEFDGLNDAKSKWELLNRKLVWLQEELDWHMYVAYGFADSTLVATKSDTIPISPSERSFEIQLARDIETGEAETSWFNRHRRTPIIELPADWPDGYKDLVERRLSATSGSRELRLLEQPEYKRRWVTAGWDELLARAVHTAILDLLDVPGLWADSAGRPLVRSVAQVADELRHDEQLRELMMILAGSRDYNLEIELGKLMQDEAVPAFASLRYKSIGIEKFRAWEQTWELQRTEDRGEQVTVPVPPMYKPADFLKNSYWSARGKLDVPKERFISFPGSLYPEDSTAVYGWAGWNHSERGQAIARFASQIVPVVAESEPDQVLPLVGALIELQPWLDQWHDDLDARGIKPSTAISQVTNTLLSRLRTGREEVLAWFPPTPKRGRKRA